MGELLTVRKNSKNKEHLYREFVGDTYITLCGQNMNQKKKTELKETGKREVLEEKDNYCVKCLRIEGLLEWYAKN